MNEDFDRLIDKASHDIARALVTQPHSLRVFEIKEALTALAQAFRVEPSQPTTQQSGSFLMPAQEQGSGIMNKITIKWLENHDLTIASIESHARMIEIRYSCKSVEHVISSFAIHAIEAIRALEQVNTEMIHTLEAVLEAGQDYNVRKLVQDSLAMAKGQA